MPSLFRRKSNDLATDSGEVDRRVSSGTRTPAAKASGPRPSTAKSAAAKAGTKATAAKAGATKATATKATSLKSSTLAAKKGAPVRGTKATSLKSAELVEEDSAGRPRRYTASKKELGLATPKRRTGGRTAEPAPANRREANKRMRAKDREARAEARAGMMAGKEEFMPKRDQGPERALVRDIVDARHSVTRFFMPVALVLVVLQSGALPGVFARIANLLFYAMVLGLFVDSFWLTRTLKRELRERFPKSPLPPRSHYFYAIMRALAIRKLRMPAARVRVGDKV